MIRAIDVALYFINKDPDRKMFNKNLISKNDRSFYEGNARLNKYLHLAQNLFIAKNGIPLFADDLYAYDNGGVVETVRERYGALLNRKSVPVLPSDVKCFLDKVYVLFQNASLDELIDLSHEDSEWEAKHTFYAKKDQLMDSMSRASEYREQYADVLRVMEKMAV